VESWLDQPLGMVMADGRPMEAAGLRPRRSVFVGLTNYLLPPAALHSQITQKVANFLPVD
jgi:hypothetical protein